MGAKCGICRAPVVWASTMNGKKMPLDAEPSEKGDFVIVKGVTWKAKDEDRALLRPMHTSHFATCTNAADFRKPR